MYDERIRETLAHYGKTGVDARWVEGWMRLANGTLDQLRPRAWKREVRGAVRLVESSSFELNEANARSIMGPANHQTTRGDAPREGDHAMSKTKTATKTSTKTKTADGLPPRRTKKVDPIALAHEPTVELLIDQDGIHNLTEHATVRPTSADPTEHDDATTDLQALTPAETVRRASGESQDLVVFAIRLTKAERDSIHAAAGPGKATQFVRRLAVAASRGDGPTVLGILDTVQAAQ
jgi:hypothetical protein